MAKKRAGRGDGDELLDALYAAPPRAFVAVRKRVADALKAEGRQEESREVARRRRPTASVWAVNQLARRAPDQLGELLALGAKLRAGERKLLTGGGAEGFMEDARTARHKVAALARRAEGFLGEAGQKATATLGRKIAQTLHAAIIADDDTRARLEAGRLDADLAPPSSFGAAGDLATTLAASLGGRPARAEKPAPAKEARAHTHGDDRKHGGDESKHGGDDRELAGGDRKHGGGERKRAAAALRAQRRVQAAARKHAATLARAATAAERVVAERARAVDKARAAVERAEADLRAAKDALAHAETAAAAARRAADEAAATSS